MRLIILAIWVFSLVEYSYTLPRPVSGNNGTDEELDQVTNGIPTTVGEFPYMAILRYFGIFFCAGTLISPTLILTAAHCLENKSLVVVGPSPSPIQVTVNTVLLNGGSRDAVIRGVNSFIMHPFFNSKTMQNDIALMALDQPVYNVKPVYLPVNYGPFYYYPNSPAVIVGWGSTYTGGSPSNVLLKGSVIIHDDTVCNRQYGSFFSGFHMLCASALKTDTCQGDSGGPILLENGFQLGITSFGSRLCADPNYAGVYTEVTNYLGWIDETRAILG